ncbi:MAG: hypothetical protein NZ869_04100 [Thermoanaerobaculum sp.]|nr:hypothetical protein [Thermoanaerobaculum sp.]MDW7968470.1 hypothetical protein [Thermoanaerobaculum sp.]
MSGPVWRWEKDRQTICCWCLNQTTGAFVEGEVMDGTLQEGRSVCPKCYTAFHQLLVVGEQNGRVSAPAYARR